MTATLNDLLTVRPVCALCCCAFSANLPCYQMTCYHLFCQYCLPETVQGEVFRCPFDNNHGQVFPYSQDNLMAVEGVLANQAMYANGSNAQYLATVYSSLQGSINFASVPCRYFTRSGLCHPTLRNCPYDHGGAAFITNSQCPKGANCHRGEFCPYQHQQPAMPLGFAPQRFGP